MSMIVGPINIEFTHILERHWFNSCARDDDLIKYIYKWYLNFETCLARNFYIYKRYILFKYINYVMSNIEINRTCL